MSVQSPKLTLKDRFKHFLAKRIFKSEYEKIDMQRETFLTLQKDYEHKIEDATQRRNDFNAWAEKQTPADAVRIMLGNFDPKLLNGDISDLPEVLGDVEDQDPFLSKCYSLSNNDALDTIIQYLTREQIMHGIKQARTLEELNFARATLNGLSLLREEVERLAAVYMDRHARDEEFDEHEVV